MHTHVATDSGDAQSVWLAIRAGVENRGAAGSGEAATGVGKRVLAEERDRSERDVTGTAGYPVEFQVCASAASHAGALDKSGFGGQHQFEEQLQAGYQNG